MKENDLNKVLSGCGCLILLIVFGAAIAIGIAVGNFWVGVGVWFSLAVTIGGAIYYVMEDDFRTYLWTWGSFLMLLFLYAKYGEFEHRWWMAAWFLAMLAHGIVGMYAGEQKRPFHGMVAGTLALLSGGAGSAKPLQIASILVQMRLVPIDEFKDSTTPPAVFPASPTSTWMWVLLVLGFVFLVWAWVQGYMKTEGKPFIALASIGIGLLALATWLSGSRGGWWWLVAWGLAALMLGHAAHELREYYEKGAAAFGYVLMTLSLLVGVVIVLTLTGRLQPIFPAQAVVSPTAIPTVAVTPAPTQPAPIPAPAPAVRLNFDITAAGKAIKDFLQAAFKSVWGIFHLIMLYLLGYSWFKKGWPALLVPATLIVLAGIAGGLSSPQADTLIRLISSSPAGWMRDLLLFSVERFGHAGWGILLLGVAVSLALLPAMCQAVVARYKLRHLPFVQKLFGTTIAYEYVKKGANPLLMTVNSLINPIILFGLFIALWVGLRQVANAGDISLTAWGIPDLSLPSWKPVWQWPYFAMAGVLALAQIMLIPLKRKFNLLVSGISSEVNVWYILIGTFVVALFVPAGVLLFITAQAISQLLLVPLAGREITKLEEEERKQLEEEKRKQRQREEERKRLEESERRKRIEQEQRQREEERRKEEQAQRIQPSYRLNTQPVGSVVQSDLTLAVLAAESILLLCRGSDVKKIPLPIPHPIALLSLKDDGLLVVAEKQGLRLDAEGKVVQMLTFAAPASVFALNPYKTMLAYLSPASSQGRALFLEAGREIELTSGIPLGNALAFSVDGRELAIASASSVVYVLDVASRKKVAELNAPPFSEMNVTLLGAIPDGRWLVVYDKKRLVRLSKEKGLEASIGSRTNILSLSVWVERQRIILGCQNGSLRLLDFDFETVFEEKISQEPIISVAHATDGRQIFGLTQKGEIYKVEA